MVYAYRGRGLIVPLAFLPLLIFTSLPFPMFRSLALLIFTTVTCTGAISVSISDGHGQPGQQVAITISLASDQQITAVQLELALDAEQGSVGVANAGPALDDHQLLSNPVLARSLVYSANSTPLANGTVFTIPITVAATGLGSASLDLRELFLVAPDGHALAADVVNAGTLTIDFADTDNDGLHDGREQRLANRDPDDGIHSITDVNPGDDADRDGWTLAQEFAADTDPLDPDDYPDWRMDLGPITIGYNSAPETTAAPPGAPLALLGDLSADIRPRAFTHQWILCATTNAQLTWDPADIPPNHSLALARIVGVDPSERLLAPAIDMALESSIDLLAGDCLRIDFSRAFVDFQFVPGWNLVSLPLEPDQASPSSIFEGEQQVMYEYVNLPLHPRFVRPRAMQAKRGYWAYFEWPAAIGVTGARPANPNPRLRPGWNLVGYLDAAVLPPGTQAFWWDQQAQQLVPYDGRPTTPGRGYWVWEPQP
jgi:hypothetical protein